MKAALEQVMCVLANWSGHGEHDILVAAATPRSVTLFGATHWARCPDGVKDAAALTRTLSVAIDAPLSRSQCETVMVGLTVILGPHGRAMADADRVRIRGEGDVPLTVLLIADLSVVVTTVTCDEHPVRILH